MTRLYADENFARSAVETLRELGHDVVTPYERGYANQSIADDAVLAFAVSERRAVLTFNRKDFIKLHASYPDHAGIIVCTFDVNYQALARRIHALLSITPDLTGQLLRVNRPQTP